MRLLRNLLAKRVDVIRQRTRRQHIMLLLDLLRVFFAHLDVLIFFEEVHPGFYFFELRRLSEDKGS